MQENTIKQCATTSHNVRQATQRMWHLIPALLIALICTGNVQATALGQPAISTYIVTTTAPTCEISVPSGGTLALGDTTVADLSTSPLKVAGRSFAVTLSACTGSTDGTKSNLTLWGTPDTTGGSTTLFKNMLATGAAAGVGIEVTNDMTGNGSAVPVRTSSTPYAIPVTLTGGSGTVNFFAMPSRGGHAANTVTPGAVSTTLNFNMDYR
ncbi:fimbrial protein [Enterobacter ludwigii]|uniref:fimbrial protein n=1 Tax=Enterobacter ludwigii TaxID=299767 RepID=UPI0018689658|nr:fimbrial protein [Enterobacter ludwigii]